MLLYKMGSTMGPSRGAICISKYRFTAGLLLVVVVVMEGARQNMEASLLYGVSWSSMVGRYD